MGCMPDKQYSNESNLDFSNLQNAESDKKSTYESALSFEAFMPQKISFQKSILIDEGQASRIDMEAKEECEKALNLYKDCFYEYSQHDIDMAYFHSIELQKELKGLTEKVHDPAYSKLLSPQTITEMSKLIIQIRKEFEDVQSYDQEIMKEGWTEKYKKNGVTISTRRQDATVGVLINSIIDIPFQAMIAVLTEMDLYRLFIPFMEVSTQEKIVSRNCRIGYSLSKIPFLTRRQAFYQGVGYNRLKKNSTLFLYTRSIHNRADLQKQFDYETKINQDYVQLQYKYFVAKYKPLNKTEGEFTLAMNVDTKIQLIPLWLQDKISQDYGQNFMKNLIKLSKKYEGSQWEKKVEENPHLFNFYKAKISEYLEEKEK